jgi:purine nucleosidase
MATYSLVQSARLTFFAPHPLDSKHKGRQTRTLIVAFACLALFVGAVAAQQSLGANTKEKIILDTDIGSDIDDAFAVALALRSPEFQILGITSDSGDTETRAKILDRMLGEVGRQDIPIAVGIKTNHGDGLSQGRYGDGGHFAQRTHEDAIKFIIEQINRYPGEITLVTIGPLPNIGALIDQEPETFRKLKRVVMMGGSIEPIMTEYGNALITNPYPEGNIKNDIVSAQKLFLAGVPLFVMPLDSTAHLTLTEVNRHTLFTLGTPLTDALALLYLQWGGVTPTLFDPMTLAFLLDPSLCPVHPMHIRVDDQGYTRVDAGPPNAQVCLHSDADAVLRFIMRRLVDQ